jgi:hypothetical protein
MRGTGEAEKPTSRLKPSSGQAKAPWSSDPIIAHGRIPSSSTQRPSVEGPQRLDTAVEEPVSDPESSESAVHNRRSAIRDPESAILKWNQRSEMESASDPDMMESASDPEPESAMVIAPPESAFPIGISDPGKQSSTTDSFFLFLLLFIIRTSTRISIDCCERHTIIGC